MACRGIPRADTPRPAPTPSYNPRLHNTRPNQTLVSALLLAAGLLCLPACKPTPTELDPRIPSARALDKHPTTLAIDRFDPGLARTTDGTQRLSLYAQRWTAVQRAVAYHGTTHRDAFYGSRAYWHTGSTRGIGWALDQPGDLNEAFYIATKGNALITGAVNKDIEIAGNCVVHILGDLNATLDLKGICEVVIAGNLTQDATIICDGANDFRQYVAPYHRVESRRWLIQHQQWRFPHLKGE